MKWVKTAIGAVIAIISIGIIATSVYSMTQETVKEEVVTFEVLTFSGGSAGNGTTDINVYNLLDEYGVYNEIDLAINLTSVKVNNNSINMDSVDIENTTTYYSIIAGDYNLHIKPDNVMTDDGGGILPQVSDVWAITFEVTQAPKLSGITATLILLTPLIFAGGLLAYLLNKQEH